MNKKTFRLPSEFAQKWLTALRSGEYTQMQGQLIDCDIAYPYKRDDTENLRIARSNTKRGCCLGVAAIMCGATDKDLLTYGMPFEVKASTLDRIKYPQELRIKLDLVNHPKTPLPILLADLNDGISLKSIENIKEQYPNIIFSKIPEDYLDDMSEEIREHYSFEDIAKFIEDNVEFYEDEGVQEVS